MTMEMARPSVKNSAQQFYALMVLNLVLCVLYIGAEIIDPRMVGADGNWVKPLKFALSFVVLFGTMALVAARLSVPVRDGWAMRVIFWVMAVNFAGEVGYMSVQAAHGAASHFNTTTPLHAMAYQMMGVSAVLLITGIAAMGVVVARDKAAALGPNLRLGVVWGFGLTFLLTFIVAGYMGGNGSHFVGQPGPDARVLPLFGWSGSVGDLRPAHFLSLHVMQALPLLGLWADRLSLGRAVMWGGAVLWTVLTLALFAQALLGVPVIRLM